jgi:hypothetical protein
LPTNPKGTVNMYFEELNVPFDFAERPTPLSADMRPAWRISVLMLILRKCWGNRASSRQLHVLNWAIRTDDSRKFLDVMNGVLPPDRATVRFEPSLQRALAFAAAEKLCSRVGDRIQLAARGEEFAQAIIADTTVLLEEKEFLQKIRGKITQLRVDAMLKWEDAVAS